MTGGQPPQAGAAPGARRSTKWVILVVVPLVVVLLDQVTKVWASDNLIAEEGGRITLIPNFMHLTYARNPGAAWGFLGKKSPEFRRPFFMAVSLVALVFILYLYYRLQHDQILLMVSLTLVMGGALGNFIDRVRFDYVVDFLDIHILGTYKWPTFNIADVAITLGVLLLMIEMLLSARAQKRRAARPADEGEADV